MGTFLQKEDRQIRDKEHLLKSLFLSRAGAAKEKLNFKSQQINALVLGSLKMRDFTLNNLENFLKRNVRVRLEQEKHNLKGLEKDLGRLNPHYVLERGYTRTEINGIPINQSKVFLGDEITTFALLKKIKSKIALIEKYDQ